MEPERLAAIPFFAALSEQVRDAVAEAAFEVEAAAGETLATEGDFGYALYAIESGTAEVTADGTPLRALGPGDVFGEIAVLASGRRTATVVASEPMRRSSSATSGRSRSATRRRRRASVRSSPSGAPPAAEPGAPPAATFPPAMRARIWGCRGSLATPGEATVRYGGNTTCVELRAASGAVVVLDAGTGVRDLGRTLVGRVREIDLLLTHLHLDHIEGLGFFAPLFDPGCTIHVHGPRPDGGTLEEMVSAYLSPPYFPVPFERIDATITFAEVERDTFELDGLRVTSVPVKHPGPTLAYRIEEDGSSLAFVPDNEPGLDPSSGLEVAGGADLLLHDAQYTDEEYASRVGWGHCAISHLTAYLREAAPRRAVMVHHDPTHADGQLEAMLERVRSASGHGQLELGREGLELSPA